jgi:DNA-binding transcriptional LysR family regulator
MITLDRLRYFIEVATIEHVGRAGKNLAVSPSVISSAIKVLEEELQCSLFTKEKNRIKLNENGQVLLEKSKVILKNTNLLYSEIGSSELQLEGLYKIGASPFLLEFLLIDTFLDIQNDNTGIKADFSSLDTGLATSQVISGMIDFAVIFRSIQHQDLEEHTLYEGEFQIAVRKDHPILKLSKNKRVKRLNKLPAVTFRTSAGPNFCENHPVFNEFNIQPTHTYFYDNNAISIKLLSKTDGWAFLPDIVIKSNQELITKLELPGKWNAPMKISIIKNKNRITSPMFDKFKKNLTNKLTK